MDFSLMNWNTADDEKQQNPNNSDTLTNAEFSEMARRFRNSGYNQRRRNIRLSSNSAQRLATNLLRDTNITPPSMPNINSLSIDDPIENSTDIRRISNARNSDPSSSTNINNGNETTTNDANTPC